MMQMTPLYILWLIHIVALLGLAAYGLHRIWMLVLLFRLRSKGVIEKALQEPAVLPCVTVQLPLYNERFVAKRLLDAAAALEWPRHLLEIQVLDDSTDTTRELVDERVAHWQDRGIDMKAIRRKRRDGFKAGALAHGMASANGEFIAVLDADFMPGTDFLRRTIGFFSDSTVGMVQCRWGFLNEEHSWLTRVQSLLLAAHFRIEQYVRSRSGLCFNFNGTAGIWRKTTIQDAGGWQADTVTEDLDISYRAQLRGWRFVYLDNYEVPSELPTTMAAFRNQQQRWTKGSIQTARKLLPAILSSKRLSISAKSEAVAHLISNMIWLFCFFLILTLYPAVKMDETVIALHLLQMEVCLFLFASGAVMLYSFVYAVHFRSESVYHIPLIPVLAMGIAPVLSFSVIAGLFTMGGVFQRTPKYGILGKTRPGFSGNSLAYHAGSISAIFINIPVFFYSILPVIFLWHHREWTVIFPLLFPLGLFWVLMKDVQGALVWAAGTFHPIDRRPHDCARQIGNMERTKFKVQSKS